MSDSLSAHGLQPARLHRPWNFPGKNAGVGCHFLLQGIFPTQGLNTGSPALQADSLPLSQLGSLAIAILKLVGSIMCVIMMYMVWWMLVCIMYLISTCLFFVINRIVLLFFQIVFLWLFYSKKQCLTLTFTHTHAFKDISNAGGWKEWSAPGFWKSPPGGSDNSFLKVEYYFKSFCFFNPSGQSLKTSFSPALS